MLEHIADNTGLAVVSVEHRLAPEAPLSAWAGQHKAGCAWTISGMCFSRIEMMRPCSR